MDLKYKFLRDKLDELGYKQVLSLNSVPLVEKLVADLVQTTESLQKYMKIAKEAMQVIVFQNVSFDISNSRCNFDVTQLLHFTTKVKFFNIGT